MSDYKAEAHRLIEQKVARLEKLGVSEHIIARERGRVEVLARTLEGEARAQQPEVIAAFMAAHPGFEENPEEPGLWQSAKPINQAEIDAWEVANADDRACLEAAQPSTPVGESVEMPSGAVYVRLQITAGGGDYGTPLGDPLRAAWERVQQGAHGERPERDYGAITIADWVMAQPSTTDTAS